ncbi:hypothetical protein ABI59_01785 [Acidobacteria bacterium Mor1]|nr:hypothetical protein ABI59_01785 [Acidobacteria bacterium Mor1]
MYAPGPQDRVWFNGRWMLGAEARLPLADPGLLAGYGLFETLAIEEDLVLDVDEHLVRLRRSAEALGIALPGLELLSRVAWMMPSALAVRQGWVKILVTRGRNCVMFGGQRPAAAPQPAHAVLLPWRRDSSDPLVNHKTLNYAGSIMGLEHARAQGADEGIWRNQRGHLTEACTANLFVLRHRRLYTASARDGILPGVTRGKVLQAARAAGLAVHEGKLRLERLQRADEAFLSSSLQGVRPLIKFQRGAIGSGSPGPWTRRLAEEVARLRMEQARAARPGPAEAAGAR